MTEAASEIILHNYPQSPVAEKVRVALGIKGASWRSVEIPRLPPKPMLTKLSGGYRRTPVMQIGADIYCDSQCIIRELERRQSEPTLFPNSSDLMWVLSRWTDGAYLDLAVKVVLGAGVDNLPADFAEDRGRLYLGPDWAKALRAANAELPHLVSQIRAPYAWLDNHLSDGRKYILGDAPAAIDAQIYYCVWFLRGRWDQGPVFLSEFKNLVRWEDAILKMGHGKMSEMSPEDAIQRAAECSPVQVDTVDTNDPQGFEIGQSVVVSPDVDGGEQPVEGTLAAISYDTVTVARNEPDVGDLQVHFPRAGYKIEAR